MDDNDNVQPWVPSGIEGISEAMVEAATARMERIRTATLELWELLLVAHDKKDWATLGFRSFKAYVELGVGLSKSQAYKLLTQGKVIQAIEQASQAEESHARDSSAEGDESRPVSGDVSVRDAAVLKDDLPAAAAEIAAATADGVPVKDAVAAAVAKRKPGQVVDAASTEVAPGESQGKRASGGVEASEAHVEPPLRPAPAVQQSFAWSNVEDPREAYQAALVEVEVADDDVLFMLGRYKAGQGAEKMIPLMRKVLAGLLIDHPAPPPATPSLPVTRSLERRTVTPSFKK